MLAEGLAMYPALYLYPWDLASLAWMKSSGNQIPLDIPVVRLYDFSHPNQIPGKDCPFAYDGERYYFTKQVPRDASGKRSKRKAGEQGAFWKSTSRDIDIKNLDEKLIGYMRKYALYEDKDCKRSANWYMEEYRVHNPGHELVNNYVLCKIYDKDSQCQKYTDTSIRALRERFIKRQLGSHLDQTNSLFVNRNQSQTQFDGSDSHEDIIMEPPSENFPPESILPTSGPPSDNKVLHGLSNEFSMSRDPSGNLNPPESIRPIPSPPDYSYGFSTSRDASGSQNPPDSVRQFAFLNNDDFLHELDNSKDWTNNIFHHTSGNQNAPAREESPPDLLNYWDSHC